MRSVPYSKLEIGQTYGLWVDPEWESKTYSFWVKKNLTELIDDNFDNIPVVIKYMDEAKVELTKVFGLWDSIFLQRHRSLPWGGPKEVLIMNKLDYNQRWGLRYVS